MVREQCLFLHLDSTFWFFLCCWFFSHSIHSSLLPKIWVSWLRPVTRGGNAFLTTLFVPPVKICFIFSSNVSKIKWSSSPFNDVLRVKFSNKILPLAYRLPSPKVLLWLRTYRFLLCLLCSAQFDAFSTEQPPYQLQGKNTLIYHKMNSLHHRVNENIVRLNVEFSLFHFSPSQFSSVISMYNKACSHLSIRPLENAIQNRNYLQVSLLNWCLPAVRKPNYEYSDGSFTAIQFRLKLDACVVLLYTRMHN